jgi:hypothetical protein
MNEDPTVPPAEPTTTLRNLIHETSTRTRDGVIPTGYGTDGGFVAPEDDRSPDEAN